VRFQASAHDGHDLISEGTHERFIIDVARFNEKLSVKRRAAGH
jgi:fluoroacetyl-CoA thioesterase